MFEWSEEHQMIREAVKRFVDDEIRPHVEELEHGDLPPYDIIRKMLKTFGMDALARDRFAATIAREKSLAERNEAPVDKAGGSRGGDAGMSMIPTIELCRVCPGMVTAMGVSMGLASAAIMSKGTIAQKERWALDLMTMDKVGAWAITEPGSGSDAFGSMKSTARRDGAKATFMQERSGVAAMALGVIEECLQLSVQYAKDRVQFGKPIGEFQLIQEKLARMEVARLNVQNLVFRTIEMGSQGKLMTLAEASAMKLYSARAAVEVAMEAVQIFGGNGYMSEFRVEQLARDSKVLQIYAGTDEIQITHIAKDLLRR